MQWQVKISSAGQSMEPLAALDSKLLNIFLSVFLVVKRCKTVAARLQRCHAQVGTVRLAHLFEWSFPLRASGPGINLSEYSIIMTANVTEDRTITHSGPECISVAAILILNCLSPLLLPLSPPPRIQQPSAPSPRIPPPDRTPTTSPPFTRGKHCNLIIGVI